MRTDLEIVDAKVLEFNRYNEILEGIKTGKPFIVEKFEDKMCKVDFHEGKFFYREGRKVSGGCYAQNYKEEISESRALELIKK